MKLLRYGPLGAERPGLLDPGGILRDLGDHIEDWEPDETTQERLRRVGELDPRALEAVSHGVRIGPVLAGIGKFVAIGLNYRDHAAEAHMAVPAEPVVFLKATSCICGAYDPIILPRDSVKTDWEVELGVVIGREARYVDQRNALDYVLGYTVINDVSEREYQLERGGTWDKGKSCDTFGPVGPWLVTADEIPDPQNLCLWLDVNGRRMQNGNTRAMIFSVAQLVSYVSRFMTLRPGDLIATGTPPGVGLGQKPHPIFLKAGDEVSLGIDHLGTQRHIVASDPTLP